MLKESDHVILFLELYSVVKKIALARPIVKCLVQLVHYHYQTKVEYLFVFVKVYAIFLFDCIQVDHR